MIERRARDKVGISTGGELSTNDVRDRGGGASPFQFDIEADLSRKLGEDLGEGRNLFTLAGVQSTQLIERARGHRSGSICGTVEREVVDHHDLPTAQMHVNLDPLRTERDGLPN